MNAGLLIIPLLLTSCTSVTNVRGPYAAALLPNDVQQIRHLAQEHPHFGHTVFTLDAMQRNQVHVRTREYIESGSNGENFYVTRRNGRWIVDERYPRFSQPERIVVTN